VASRQEEKERRKREREEAERQAKAKEQRKRRLLFLGGGVALLVVLIAAGVVVASSGGGGKSSSDVPPLATAAKAAGCTVKNYPKGYQDRQHTTATVHYKTNPPSYGPHNPIPAQDGDYVGRITPTTEHLVHALEHGRIEVQYKKGTPKSTTSDLEDLFNEKSQYMLLFENETNMPYGVAAVAWTHILGCPSYNAKVPDAIRAFRDQYTLKGPELITQPE
jgi:hypothetical protein